MSTVSIIVVEDEGIVALQIQESLRNRGYAVPAIAHSGEEALRAVTLNEPDLLVVDIRLKGAITGIEVARRVRATFRIPVIFLTAHSDAETLRQAAETEPCGYLVKPFDDRALDAAIQISLVNSRRAKEERERARWTAAIPNSITDPVLLTDDKGLVKFVNVAAERFLGTGLEQVLNHRLGDVVTILDPATRESLLPPVTEPLAEGRPAASRGCVVVGADGAERSCELVASPLVSAEGSVFGLLYLLR